MIKNRLNILGQGVAIKFRNSRHYSVLISKRYETLDKFTENSKSIFLSIDNKSDRQVSKKKENSRKLHNQFGNSNARKILRLVKVSGIQCNEIFDTICETEENWSIWMKYEKSPLKPVVEFSLSKDFNVAEAMDLIEVNGSKILHDMKF